MSRFYRPLPSPTGHTDPYGGTGWNRTNDTLGFNQVLYQLSYSSMWRRAQNSNLIPEWYDPLSGRSPDLLGSLSMFGWGGWIRTSECRCQRPVPYHLATLQYWQGQSESNTYPTVLETVALPVELYPRVVMPAGLEPAISSLRGWRPNQLDEGTVWRYGPDSNRRITALQAVLLNLLSTVSWLG